MTQRYAPMFLLTALLAAGPALAQTAVPAPDQPTITPPAAGETAPEPALTQPPPPVFTPVPVDDPLIPAPIASRAVAPDYSAPPVEPRPADPADDPAPEPSPVVDGVPTEPEQTATSPEAARARAAPTAEPTQVEATAPAAETPSQQSLETTGQADPDSVADAATPPDPENPDGTSPGSAGSSGWTGGLGGSTIGTNPSGAVPESRTWQPPTSRGLDLNG